MLGGIESLGYEFNLRLETMLLWLFLNIFFSISLLGCSHKGVGDKINLKCIRVAITVTRITSMLYLCISIHTL